MLQSPEDAPEEAEDAAGVALVKGKAAEQEREIAAAPEDPTKAGAGAVGCMQGLGHGHISRCACSRSRNTVYSRDGVGPCSRRHGVAAASAGGDSSHASQHAGGEQQ